MIAIIINNIKKISKVEKEPFSHQTLETILFDQVLSLDPIFILLRIVLERILISHFNRKPPPLISDEILTTHLGYLFIVVVQSLSHV